MLFRKQITYNAYKNKNPERGPDSNAMYIHVWCSVKMFCNEKMAVKNKNKNTRP